MVKRTLKIANLFNKPYRIQLLDYLGKKIVGKFENGPNDCCRIDILLEGHYSVADLQATKTFGPLFNDTEHTMSFVDINAIASVVHASFERPVDPLLTSSTHPKSKNGSTDVTQDTLFNLSIPDASDLSSAIRNTYPKQGDKTRKISFISLVHILPREIREAVAFE